jgi:hypothetical protein
MNRNQDVTYGVDFCAGGKGRRNSKAFSSPQPPSDVPGASSSIPRIARLMALAIRFDALLREDKIQDYAELARRGRVTRARMTQIMNCSISLPTFRNRSFFFKTSQASTRETCGPLFA